MDAAEQQIKELREDLNRRFDQLVEMIRKDVPYVANENVVADVGYGGCGVGYSKNTRVVAV